jgi:hypothetical protein
MKRDVEIIINLFSYFIHVKLYGKGMMAETIGGSREKIRILLSGRVSIFEPLNHKSYKYCENKM